MKYVFNKKNLIDYIDQNPHFSVNPNTVNRCIEHLVHERILKVPDEHCIMRQLDAKEQEIERLKRACRDQYNFALKLKRETIATYTGYIWNAIISTAVITSYITSNLSFTGSIGKLIFCGFWSLVAYSLYCGIRDKPLAFGYPDH